MADDSPERNHRGTENRKLSRRVVRIASVIGLILGVAMLIVGVTTPPEGPQECSCHEVFPGSPPCTCGQPPSPFPFTIAGAAIVVISTIGLLFSFRKPGIRQGKTALSDETSQGTGHGKPNENLTGPWAR